MVLYVMLKLVPFGTRSANVRRVIQLKDLLDLKQQQAYVLEARVSRNEAISSGVQSKTIMVFTIVTIIFVRISCI